uniref:Uncharacterized protein n=1 Tax=Candidozyma auris TaxID=498019 RepID=A0A0L0NN26_CANAR
MCNTPRWRKELGVPSDFAATFPHPENIFYKQQQLNEDNVEGLLSKPFMLSKLSLLLLLLLLLPATESPLMVQRDIFLESGPLQKGLNLSLR